MIRLPSNHAAITAPLVASSTQFPGIPIGRSLLDGRPFHLSPVLADTAILPSTNSLALGGLGSGKSTTAKVRTYREIRDHGHQAVVIDSFGEDGVHGEWQPVVQALGGQVVQAGSFTLNPCSDLFPPQVREQLIRSLVVAVEPGALSHQATHALQHALNHPKTTSLDALVDALVTPEDGRWSAQKLAEWGEGAAIALSRYTEGSLSGMFDGPDAALPETDLPILSFDFTGLDRNSPAIPSLMAAVMCWAEHIWLRQSTAVHRHLVLEEAWQILLSPATSALIQRQLKNSRRAALSLDVVMHTLSDLGDGRAQDLARLCEIAHVGRLGPEEAAVVGALLGLPQWAVDTIPTLGPGQAVWKVGPNYVDIVQTMLSEEEARLTDTSSRRRAAQQALVQDSADEQNADDVEDDGVEEDPDQAQPSRDDQAPQPEDDEDSWDWEMPPNVIDTRHHEVLQAAQEGRCNEAAQLAAIGEREDINAHGIDSDQAVSWLATRARVAELCGDPHQAARLRATVARMGKDVEWYEKADPSTEWYRGPQPEPPTPTATDAAPTSPSRRRTWLPIAVVAALALAAAGVWNKADSEQQSQKEQRKQATYKGFAAADVRIDGVAAETSAEWSKDGHSVIVSVWVAAEEKPGLVRIDASGQVAKKERENIDSRDFGSLMPIRLEVSVPINDRWRPVDARFSVRGANAKPGAHVPHRTVRFTADGVALDAESGERLKHKKTSLL
ncbi:hypothetical protein GCM10010218_64090 [Streptomyces mashuensis]|uniref:ATP/GTP-binding protein n=1 Tax=Streptomyces mashuensis TaxID=33904 RepID=A0A919EFJ5_9ACTN|nr:hypothetical protein [Streptomyces mashuensis]GHF74157.1 hypothetical protein GCM10010218_64090 [Streptomyces mashuensis]